MLHFFMFYSQWLRHIFLQRLAYLHAAVFIRQDIWCDFFVFTELFQICSLVHKSSFTGTQLARYQIGRLFELRAFQVQSRRLIDAPPPPTTTASRFFSIKVRSSTFKLLDWMTRLIQRFSYCIFCVSP